jgi:hypothetical protein
MGAESGLVMEPGDIVGVSFHNRAGHETCFMFADLDAACWAAAVNRIYGLDTENGISLLFRLLALIEIMSEARWLQPYFSLGGKDGATLHPKLLAAAASEPLSGAGQFDLAAFKAAMCLSEETKRHPRPVSVARGNSRGSRGNARR